MKLRIRVYGDEIGLDSAAMVEIKGKSQGATIKQRLGLTLLDAYRLSTGVELGPFEADDDALLAKEIALFAKKIQLRPAAAIGYRRAAFVGSGADSGVRITLDQRLGCRGPHLRLHRRGAYSRFLPPDWAILEIKTSRTFPRWLEALVARHAVARPISKYVAALRHLTRDGSL